MERQFEDVNSMERWHNLYMEIRDQSHECSYKVAKYPENRLRNRYRDVSPYDHSRVKLKNLENDYINASLIVMEEAQRNYILTQGPLKNTCGHFWLMVWEQRTKAVIMLNRVIEKGSEKCAQYWPTPEEQEMSFKDTHFVVKLLSENVKSYYTIRALELQNTDTEESREIHHFHYTTWPDFGVPESPASFLNFLFKVRESGSLEPEHGPSVVHCSAGIGRSGTFSLVDTCLVLMEKRKDPSSVDIQKVLLEMRKYRMGLIQTPDQLRFSDMAINEGAKYIMGDRSVKNEWEELSNEGQEPVWESSEPLMAHPTDELKSDRFESKEADWPKPDHEESIESCTRQRHREARKVATAQKVQQMKQRLYDTEQKRQRWLYWRPILLGVGAGVTLALGLYVGWTLASK